MNTSIFINLIKKFKVSNNSLTNLQSIRHGGSIAVILRQDIEDRGIKGDIIAVKRGFARNYLVPRKLAAYATEVNKEIYKVEKKLNKPIINEKIEEVAKEDIVV